MRIKFNKVGPLGDGLGLVFEEDVATGKDLLDFVKLGHLNECRLLKVPDKVATHDGTGIKIGKGFQKIEINPSNINSTLVDLGFQDNATYTFI